MKQGQERNKSDDTIKLGASTETALLVSQPVGYGASYRPPSPQEGHRRSVMGPFNRIRSSFIRF